MSLKKKVRHMDFSWMEMVDNAFQTLPVSVCVGKSAVPLVAQLVVQLVVQVAAMECLPWHGRFSDMAQDVGRLPGINRDASDQNRPG